MEAWLLELEMERNNQENMLKNDSNIQGFENHEIIMDTFDEQLALLLGEDFPSSLFTEISDIPSPIPKYCNTNNPANLSRTPSVEQLPPLVHTIAHNNESPPCLGEWTPKDGRKQEKSVLDDHKKNRICRDKDSKEQGASVKRRRRREPNQIQDHIMAERKRRELLAQQFISLSAIVPGLKKVDKTSILGETINYLQNLRETVTKLEEVSAKQTVESMVVVRKTQVIVGDDEDGDDDSIIENNGSGHSDGNDIRDSFPEIEAKVSDKTLLLRVSSVKQKGVLAKVFAEVEEHGFNVLNSSIVPFGNSALNITVLSRMENVDNEHVKHLVKTLHSLLRPLSSD